MSGAERLIADTPDDLARLAVERIFEVADRSVRERGRFTVALAGGSTPEKTYAALARPEHAGRLDWARAWVFLSDERFVPADDARSNFGMARRSLLAHVPVPPGQVFPVPTDLPTPEDAATAYEAVLSRAFGAPPDGPAPALDLVLLGLGDDGHTASLFPGAAALQERRLWVTSSHPGTLPPPVDRVTFTFPTINAARAVLFLVAGGTKSPALRDVLDGGASPTTHPAAGVRPAGGTLTWLLDREAAALL